VIVVRRGSATRRTSGRWRHHDHRGSARQRNDPWHAVHAGGYQL